MSNNSGILSSSPIPFHSAIIPTSSSPLHLNNVLVTPSLVKNLISVRQFTRDNNVSLEFDPAGFSIKDLPTQTVKLRCDSPGDLYPLRLPLQHALSASSTASVELWHNRLGHPGSNTLHQVLRSLNFQCNKSAAHSCHHCRVGKHVRLPFSSSDTAAYFPILLVHSDVWTSPVYSHSDYKYYVVFIDAFTHYIWTFPVRQKSDVADVVRSFFSYVHTQFCLPILALQTDNSTEYDTIVMRSFLSAHGTVFRLTCPYTSPQNGKAERILRTINDCIRTLLIHSAAPLSLWAEALNTATYLINRRPCRTTGPVTPHQLLLGVPPRYDELHVFGCLCYPNLTATTAHKLFPRSLPCVFLGYPSDQRGYRCYDMSTGHVYTSRHVTFVEHAFPFRDAANTKPAPPPPESPCDDDFTPPPPPRAVAAPPPRRDSPTRAIAPTGAPSTRTSVPATAASQTLVSSPPSHAAPPSRTSTSPLPAHASPQPAEVAPPEPASPQPAAADPASTEPRQHHMVTRARAGVFKPHPWYALTSSTPVSPIPTSVRTALRDPNWNDAMRQEFDALQHNRTWTLVPRPHDARVISGKWVFKHKTGSDGSLERYKARWVVRGFHQ